MSAQTAKIQAWTFTTPGHPNCLSKTTLPAPKASELKPTQLLIRTYTTALNPVDVQIQNLPVFNIPIWPLNVPKLTGCDFAGEVLATGNAVSDFKPGDHIMGVSMWQGWNGTLGEVIIADTTSGCFVKKPQNWSWEKAGGVSLVWLTARTMIENATRAIATSKAKKLAVLGGSSATGMYVVQIAKQRGWDVLASCSGRNTDFVRSMGAGTVVDYTSQSVREEVKRWGPDAIIDCVGGTECLDLAKRYITIVGDKTSRSSMGGSLIYFWNPRMFARWALGRLGLGVEYDCSNIQMVKAWLEEATELPEEKVIVDSVFSFDDAMDAFAKLNTGRARGKVIVKVKE